MTTTHSKKFRKDGKPEGNRGQKPGIKLKKQSKNLKMVTTINVEFDITRNTGIPSLNFHHIFSVLIFKFGDINNDIQEKEKCMKL